MVLSDYITEFHGHFVFLKDYKREWDPKFFKSQKTGRGPLDTPDWKVGN